MDFSRLLRASWSVGVIRRFCGKGGRVGSMLMASMLMAEDGEDSASKMAWRTAESLVVRAGILTLFCFCLLGKDVCSEVLYTEMNK